MRGQTIFQRSLIPLPIAVVLIAFSVFLMQKQNEEILTQRLREQIQDVASMAAMTLPISLIENAVKTSNPEELKEITNRLKQIRVKNSKIKYAYILKPSAKATTMKFVVDADTFDQVSDEMEAPPQPDEDYDVSQLPRIFEALTQPTADDEINSDKWGTFLSGYAPILSKDGTTLAILGLDIEISDFHQVIRSTLVPFVLLSLLLFLIVLFQALWITKIWNSRLELRNELDRQKDELLGLVSHQLAAPISAIRWYVEMLLDGDLGILDLQQKKQLETVQASTADLNDLVGMILDVSRIQLGKIKVDKQDLDLKIFFKEILDVVKPKALLKNIKLNTILPEKFPQASLDKRYTRMTIENLLTNAIKYTPEQGQVDLVVEMQNAEMLVTVSDNGVGIPEKDQEKIFGKMFRASNVRNGSIDGNGFGLFVAKGAVEAQGGQISFKSKEGKGTSFYVRLPV